MKTEFTQKDKENLEKAKSFAFAGRFLSNQAETLIHEAVTELLQGLAAELKWEEMNKIVYDLPDSVEKFYAIQYAQAIKEKSKNPS